MSINAHAIKEIQFERSIDTFDMNSLFAQLCNAQEKTDSRTGVFDLTQDDLDQAESLLDKDYEIGHYGSTQESREEVRQLILYYRKQIEDSNDNQITFYAF